MAFVPIVVERSYEGERAYDIYSRLLQDRIILITGTITDELASSVVAQLLFLERQSSKDDIFMYINSPGGLVMAGLAIYDTMRYIKPDVSTICVGQAASMGAFLLAGGAKGKRYSLPSSRIMIHQPLGGAYGQATDVAIQAQEIIRLKEYLNHQLALNTGRTYEEVSQATERDNFMSADEALQFGIIDKIISKEEIL